MPRTDSLAKDMYNILSYRMVAAMKPKNRRKKKRILLHLEPNVMFVDKNGAENPTKDSIYTSRSHSRSPFSIPRYADVIYVLYFVNPGIYING